MSCHRFGIAAAAIDSATAIIGNGDSLANDGITSFINETAAKLGCVPGQPAMDCALAMRAAPGSSAAVESQTSAERFGVIPTTRAERWRRLTVW